MTNKDVSFLPTAIFKENDHAACGVGLQVDLHHNATHQIVEEGLKTLADFNYRSGYNPVTEESDGAGIKCYGLATDFFNKTIANGAFITSEGRPLCDLQLVDNEYAIGQYFLPTSRNKRNAAQSLIETEAKTHGLVVKGWRNLDLNEALDVSVLSEKAAEKKPGIWQAILVPETAGQSNLEKIVLKTGLTILSKAKLQNIELNIVSQSTEFIVYKGMLLAESVGAFYRDLQDTDFTAQAVGVHGRFATNTNPQWANAQPCVFLWLHNGELNSAHANALDMRSELNAMRFDGVYPDETLSDSMQFDADLANQMIMHDIGFVEAFLRLMPPPPSDNYSNEVNKMLRDFRLKRTPYNGPAFSVAGANGYYLIKLDEVGLRPSRWGIIEHQDGYRQFIASSDDTLVAPLGGKIIKKSHLEPGGMVLIDPNGTIHETKSILELVCQSYTPRNTMLINKTTWLNTINNWFVSLLTQLKNWMTSFASAILGWFSSTVSLQRILYSAGWDYESEDQVVRYMADHGMERIAAMGDDTNPLHAPGLPIHISYFFHQYFAQVSAPPLDSIKERDRFTLEIALGALPDEIQGTQQVLLDSPILGLHDLHQLSHHKDVPCHVLDTSFHIPESNKAYSSKESGDLLRQALQALLKKAEEKARRGGILILSDSRVSKDRALIPDLIAVAAVRKHLEAKNLMRRVSIVADSYQITGPHQAAALLAMGANAVYPRGAYNKITELYQNNLQKFANYKLALEKCLLKTMGKMGITDVNNYINGSLMGALGLDLCSDSEKNLADYPSLAAIFETIYSPLKGFNLSHIASNVLLRHYQAFNPDNDFTLLPRSGYYMPEKFGIKHGYGPEVVHAFTQWMQEEDRLAKVWQINKLLPGFAPNPDLFKAEQGFLDPRKKDKGNPIGVYPPDYLESIKASQAFCQMSTTLDHYKRKHPTAIRDYFSIIDEDIASRRKKLGLAEAAKFDIQRKEDILQSLFSGSMSQGALTVSDPHNPKQLGAHETLTAGMNAIGAMSASGEGGEAPSDVRNPLRTTSSKQVASGRFGISAIQLCNAKEIEIKMAQGAKPGEGGEVPGLKISVRFAAQRGGLPGTPFVSPPPHHDIYSIEDLAQLIHDIKSVNPHAKVAVKLVASKGIGTIAVGVVKAGADVINIAGNSGGTGAAQQSSIKHAGFPAELGLAEVDRALRKAKLRDLVKLRTSGGFKTADDIIIAAIFGADQFELGTTCMLTLGCKMLRTCNHSCQPGVTTDGHLFKGDQINTERYFVNLAAAIQQRLKVLGVENLQQLRGQTQLLTCLFPEVTELYDFSPLLNHSDCPPPPTENELLRALEQRNQGLARPKEDALIALIQTIFDENPESAFSSEPILLTSQDRSFGARLAGFFATHLEKYPKATIMLNTTGIAGQSIGFTLPKGMSICHQGAVQDGCAKSMTGGKLVIRTPTLENYRADENTIAGNAVAYGASGGKLFVNGVVGHRFAILLKGAAVVVEGVGDLAFEYMTSGTGLVLGKVGKGLGAGATGGILMVYDKDHTVKAHESMRLATAEEKQGYKKAILSMLNAHINQTNSLKAREIVASFDLNHFKILIPREMDKIKNLQAAIDVIKTYLLRKAPLTLGMQVWLEHKIYSIVVSCKPDDNEQLHELTTILHEKAVVKLFGEGSGRLLHLIKNKLANTPKVPDSHNPQEKLVYQKPRMKAPIETRLGSIAGALDEILVNALQHIDAYVKELSHNAAGCSGCRAQSCSGGDGCPGGKAINTINTILKRLGPIEGQLTIKQWQTLRQAFEVQVQETPFIAYTGAACPAPCQAACTEGIPDSGPANPARDGKKIGEPVQIKDIEYDLFQIGRALGWFDGKKEWSDAEIDAVFGKGDDETEDLKADYFQMMSQFSPPFRRAKKQSCADKELIIIGSGPAGMQIAFEALRDGLKVRMYEQSNKPGGLLADGIPAHKFDKIYLSEDFNRLIDMGLQLSLNSEVIYDDRTGDYVANGLSIANSHHENQHVAICVGTGKPRNFDAKVTATLSPQDQNKIVQAVDFLKAANDIADTLARNPHYSLQQRDALFNEKFGSMNPRGKKIVVVGGGDTAQDVIRWVARYFNQVERGDLNIIVRGPKPTEESHLSKENRLRDAEVEYVNGTSAYCVEPTAITADDHGKLSVQIKQSEFKYHDLIQQDEKLSQLYKDLPRELRPIDRLKEQWSTIEQVDMVICALGFQKANRNIHAKNIYYAGDAAEVEDKIIIGAQTSGKNTYFEQIRPAMGVGEKHRLTQSSRALSSQSIFARHNLENAAIAKLDDVRTLACTF